MKRIVLLTSAAVVAAVPAVLGVAGNATFSQRIPAIVPAGASVLPVPAITDDSATPSTVSPTSSPTVDDEDGRGRGADDGTSTTRSTVRPTGTTGDDHGRRGATGGGHGSDDGASTRNTSRATGTSDDHGSGIEPGDDSGGHGGTTSGSSGTGSDDSGKGSDD
jgi:hypothetical protein